MDEGTLKVRLWDGFAELQLLLGAHAGPGKTLERDGLVASIVPNAPDSPTLNAAVALEPDKATQHIDELARLYEQARVRRWGVWLDGAASLAAQALGTAGLVVTAASPGMGAELTDTDPDTDTDTATDRDTDRDRGPDTNTDTDRDPEPDPGTDHDPDGDADELHPADLATVGRVNDMAYGNFDGRLERTLTPLPNGVLRGYRVDHEGSPAAVALALHHNEDCGVSFVATVPSARRLGLATRVMRQALNDAKNNGCTTTTLQATDLGERLYANLGYKRLCLMQLWEGRR